MISAILLTAGQSKRMNGKNKLTKKIKGIPLINHSVKNILDSTIDELIIVLGYEKDIIKNLIVKNKKIKFAINENYESGLASSIKTGLNHLSNNTKAFFICLGDMPMINANIYNKLILSLNENEIVIPAYKGQQRNPILFSKSMKKKIIEINGDTGAKKILENKQDKILKIEIDDENIFKDFNTEDNFIF